MKSEKKVRKFSDLTDAELNDKLKDLKSELFNLRFQNATGQLQNPMQIGLCKKDIARSRPCCASASWRRPNKKGGA